MTTTIHALETYYAGCRFRSRLEARWAVFLDRADVRWEYEPGGVHTPAGPYLPDFLLHLPTGPTLFEVKPESGLGGIDPRWASACDHYQCRLIVAYGMPRPHQLCPSAQPGDGHLNLVDTHGDGEVGWDNYYAFCVCPRCAAVGIEFDGRGARVCGDRCCPGDDKSYTYDDGTLQAAYAAARSARFEFGERG